MSTIPVKMNGKIVQVESRVDTFCPNCGHKGVFEWDSGPYEPDEYVCVACGVGGYITTGFDGERQAAIVAAIKEAACG